MGKIKIDERSKAEQLAFAGNNENTMQPFHSSSVAVLLVRLLDLYFNSKIEEAKPPIPQVDTEQDNQQLIDPLENWLNETIEAYLKISSLNQSEKDYLQSEMNAKHNELDVVTIVNVAQDGSLHPEKRLITLKQTLALVYRGIIDDEKWPVQEGKTLQEQRQKRLAGLDGVIRAAKKISQIKSMCHQGLRNEIANCLAGYENFEIVQTEISFIENCIHDFMRQKLLPAEWQQVFKSLIWPWLRRREMPLELINLLTDEFLSNLNQFIINQFLSRGTYPDQKQTEQIAAYCAKSVLEGLACEFINDSFIYTLKGWLSEYWHDGKKSLTHAEPIQNRVNMVITWLDHGFNANDESHRNHFKEVVRLFANLVKINRIDLLIWANNHRINEIVHSLKHISDATFEQFLWKGDAMLVEMLDTFDSAYSTICNTHFTSEIENFFALWFSDCRQTRGNLLYLLCQPLFINAIKLNDEDFRLIQEQQQEDGTFPISVYKINRILLHALTVPVTEWTEIFTGILNQTVKFIEKTFNEADNQRATLLKKSSYPENLLLQLNNLLAIAYGENCIPLAKMSVLTPTLAKKVNDTLAGLKYILASNYSISERAIPVKIFTDKLNLSTIKKFMKLFSFLDNKHCIELFIAAKNQLTNNIDANELFCLLQACPYLDRQEVLRPLNTISLNKLQTPLDFYDFMRILELFPSNARLEVFIILKKQFLVKLNFSYRASYYSSSSHYYGFSRLQCWDSTDNKKIYKFLAIFQEAHRKEVLENLVLLKALPASIDALTCRELLKLSAESERLKWFNFLKDYLLTISEASLLWDILWLFKVTERDQVLDSLIKLNKLPNTIPKLSSFIELFEKNARLAVFRQLSSKLSIQEDFDYLKLFEQTERGEVFDTLLHEGKLPSRININEINMLLTRLKNEHLKVLNYLESPHTKLKLRFCGDTEICITLVNILMKINAASHPSERDKIFEDQLSIHPDINAIFCHFEEKNFFSVLTVLIKLCLENTTLVANSIHAFLTPNDTQALNLISEKLPPLSIKGFLSILGSIDETECLLALNALKDKLVISDSNHLVQILSYYDGQDFSQAVKALENHWQQLNTENYINIIEICWPYKRLFLLNLLQEYWTDPLSNQQFSSLLAKFKPNEHGEVFNLLLHKLNDYSAAFNLIIDKLKSEQRLPLFSIFVTKLTKLNSLEIHEVLKPFTSNETECLAAIKILNNKWGETQAIVLFNQTLRYFKITQNRIELLSILPNTMSTETFISILSKFNKKEYLSVLENINDRLEILSESALVCILNKFLEPERFGVLECIKSKIMINDRTLFFIESQIKEGKKTICCREFQPPVTQTNHQIIPLASSNRGNSYRQFKHSSSTPHAKLNTELDSFKARKPSSNSSPTIGRR